MSRQDTRFNAYELRLSINVETEKETKGKRRGRRRKG